MSKTHAEPMPHTGWERLGLAGRVLGSLRSRRALRAARRSADADLLRTRVPSLRVAWRAAELVVPKKRLELARVLRNVVRDADARYLPNAAPINRPAVRDASDTLLAMADRLADLESPVAPRGVLLVERLLLDGSALYDSERTGELLDQINEASAALDLP